MPESYRDIRHAQRSVITAPPQTRQFWAAVPPSSPTSGQGRDRILAPFALSSAASVRPAAAARPTCPQGLAGATVAGSPVRLALVTCHGHRCRVSFLGAAPRLPGRVTATLTRHHRTYARGRSAGRLTARHRLAHGSYTRPARRAGAYLHRVRGRRVAMILGGLVVLALAGGYAALALTGGDTPPPPRLAGGTSAGGISGVLRPVAGSFAGYRVREKYLGVGVRTAVGRTGAVTGTVSVAGGRVTAAELTADMRTLRSDQARRDATLGHRAIETERFPRARFTLGGPVAISARPRPAAGTLLLHGRRAPIAVTLRGRTLANGRLELVGSAPIRFARFAIAPPSVAGLVTVEDHGLLEFRLVLRGNR
jgi:polyisoprenoid-binding protein YceI